MMEMSMIGNGLVALAARSIFGRLALGPRHRSTIPACAALYSQAE